MKLPIVLFAIAVAVAGSPPARAAVIGTNDNFTPLARIHATSEQIQRLHLPPAWADAELVEHSVGFFLFAGWWVQDDGYAIRPAGGDYWKLDDQLIAELQAEKILPSPMPRPRIDPIHLITGYSVYLVIAGLMAFYGLKAMLVGRPAGKVQ